MIDLAKYDNIIFDFGGVVLNIQYDLTIKELSKNFGVDISVLYTQSKQSELFDAFERGEISSASFREKIKKLVALHTQVSHEIDDETFDYGWNKMLLDIPHERLDFLTHLKSIKKIYLLSNINAIHEIACDKIMSSLERGSLQDYFHGVYFSHLIKHRKPEREAFDYVMRENHLDKKKTLFIDDSLQHIHGAREYGIDAYHLKAPQETIFDIFS